MSSCMVPNCWMELNCDRPFWCPVWGTKGGDNNRSDHSVKNSFVTSIHYINLIVSGHCVVCSQSCCACSQVCVM